jgi:hypothetical protein
MPASGRGVPARRGRASREPGPGQPGAFLPDLAMALNTQSNHLSGLGRPEDALAAVDEAVPPSCP